MLRAHKKNSYYTLAILYCTFCVRKHTIFNPVWWRTLTGSQIKNVYRGSCKIINKTTTKVTWPWPRFLVLKFLKDHVRIVYVNMHVKFEIHICYPFGDSNIQRLTSNLSKAIEMRDSLAVSVCRLPWSISIHFIAIHSWNLCCSQKLSKILKSPILGFNVVQGHRCWHIQKARHQCLLWYAASLYLYATVFSLYTGCGKSFSLFSHQPFRILIRNFTDIFSKTFYI